MARKIRARVRNEDGTETIIYPQTLLEMVKCLVPKEDGSGQLKTISLDELINQYADEINENTAALAQNQDLLNAANDAVAAANAAAEAAGNKADINHSHSAGDINSGTLPIARGGTGATSASAALSALGAATSAQGTKADNALPKSGGTMTGILYGQTNTSYTTAQVRNIYATTTDLTAGSSSLANGTICVVYE